MSSGLFPGVSKEPSAFETSRSTNTATRRCIAEDANLQQNACGTPKLSTCWNAPHKFTFCTSLTRHKCFCKAIFVATHCGFYVNCQIAPLKGEDVRLLQPSGIRCCVPGSIVEQFPTANLYPLDEGARTFESSGTPHP
jgi:hypothetical protein